MNRTLLMCPPQMRAGTIRALQDRVERLAEETQACAVIAAQLDLAAINEELSFAAVVVVRAHTDLGRITGR